MEMFTGDRFMAAGVVLHPDNLTHFPSRRSDDHSPGIFAPQKLRPVRCYGRNSTDPNNGGVPEEEGSLISSYGHPVEELGLKKSDKGKEVGESSGGGQDFLGSCAFPGNLGVSLEKPSTLSGVECNNKFEAELRPLSESAEEALKSNEKPSNKKRKRRTKAKLESYVERMIISVMQKQEQLHRDMIDILEKKENERLAKEEAWKQQEIERAKKEREERAQETSRSLALISYIQKLMGHEIQIPPFQEKARNDMIPNQEDITCGPSNNNQEKLEELNCRPSSKQGLEMVKYVAPGNSQEDVELRDPNNKRWPKSEVQALITVRTALSQKFNLKGSKNSIWEEVAVGMLNLGYDRTAKKCKEKWDNINKYYKRLVESGSTKRSDKRKACPYFNELELLYKSGFFGSPNVESSIKVMEENAVQSSIQE